MNHADILQKLITAPAVPERVYRTAHYARDCELLQWARERVPALSSGGMQLVSGKPEAGKTFAALYLAAALRLNDKKLRVGHFTAPEIGRMMFDDKDRFGKLHQYGCLVIDDLGTNPLGKSDWTALQWDDLINRVYASCGILILTSNLSLTMIEDQYGDRIASRFKEGGAGYYMAAPDAKWRTNPVTGEYKQRERVVDTSEPFGPAQTGGEIVYYQYNASNPIIKGIRGKINPDTKRQDWNERMMPGDPPEGAKVYTPETWVEEQS